MKRKNLQNKQVKVINLRGKPKKLKKINSVQVLISKQELIEYYQIHNERTQNLLKKYDEINDM